MEIKSEALYILVTYPLPVLASKVILKVIDWAKKLGNKIGTLIATTILSIYSIGLQSLLSYYASFVPSISLHECP